MYKLNGKVAAPQVYIQAALIELLAQDWGASDEIVIFLTEDAYKNNWLTPNPHGYVGLKDTIQALNPALPIKEVHLNHSIQNLENWEALFETIFEQINEGDEIYFDVTHGFRALPLFTQTIMSYTKLLKNINVGGILYGNFSALGNIKQVTQMANEDRIAPVIDLIGMITIEEWTVAVNSFIASGDTTLLHKIVDSDMNEILSLTRGQNTEATAIKYFVKELHNFSSNIRTVRMDVFPQTSKDLLDKLTYLREVPLETYLLLEKLIGKVEEELSGFSGDSVIMDTYYAAEWCVSKGLVQQGFTILEEGMQTALVLALGLFKEADYYQKPNKRKQNIKIQKEIRKIAKSLIIFLQKNLKQDEWKWLGRKPTAKQLKLLEEYYQQVIEFQDSMSILNLLTKIRNNINHAEMAQNDIFTPEILEKRLKELLDSSRLFFEEMNTRTKALDAHQITLNQTNFMQAYTEQTETEREETAMFILLSHELTDKQKEDARDMLKVSEFIPLPEALQTEWSQVNPEGIFDGVHLKPIFDFIHKYPTDKEKILLVQGELSMIISTLNWAKKEQLKAYYSTTERKSVDIIQADGTVVTDKVFAHVTYREFPEIE